MVTRRRIISAGTMLLASAGSHLLTGQNRQSPGAGRIPLIHTTDLYHPPQDPDDHLDLATVAALPELDLRGVILDVTQRFLDPAPAGADIARDPGFVPVAQIGYLLGRSIAVAAGPTKPLESPEDTAENRPPGEQAGIRLLLDLLDQSPEPAVISVLGSARVVTAAYNRNPRLVKAKTRSVVLNAGSTGGVKQEWNEGLDPAAYVGLWKSRLPIDWYPCATETGAFNPGHERGTYWKTTHAQIFRDIPDRLGSWFAYGFTGSHRGDILRVLAEGAGGAAWEKILADSRNLWATASLVLTAGRVLARSRAGWRFALPTGTGGDEVWPWRLDPIEARLDSSGRVSWSLAKEGTGVRLFGRRSGAEFGAAMAEAMQALLAGFPR